MFTCQHKIRREMISIFPPATICGAFFPSLVAAHFAICQVSARRFNRNVPHMITWTFLSSTRAGEVADPGIQEYNRHSS